METYIAVVKKRVWPSNFLYRTRVVRPSLSSFKRGLQLFFWLYFRQKSKNIETMWNRPCMFVFSVKILVSAFACRNISVFLQSILIKKSAFSRVCDKHIPSKSTNISVQLTNLMWHSSAEKCLIEGNCQTYLRCTVIIDTGVKDNWE